MHYIIVTTGFIMRSVMIVLLTHYCAGDKIEKNEKVAACCAYGGGERRVQGFGGKP
jgi:hypothetical protein